MVRERALAGPEQARIARAPRPLQGRGELSQVATDVRTGLRQPLAEPHCTGLHWPPLKPYALFPLCAGR